MNPSRGFVRSLTSAVALALVIAAWLVFAPLQVGGQAAYAIVSGNSMEPGFHRGDLVVLRQTADYQLGDVVTYRHPTLGPVIHRIIAENDGRFVLKGDNNTWLDSHQPTQAEMIGKLWVYVPHLGGIIEQVRRPWAAALLAALGGIAHRFLGCRRCVPPTQQTASPADGAKEADHGGSILTCRPDGPLHASRDARRCIADAGPFCFHPTPVRTRRSTRQNTSTSADSAILRRRRLASTMEMS